MKDEITITLNGPLARALRINAHLLGMEPSELAAALIESGEMPDACGGGATAFENFAERFVFGAPEAAAVATRASEYFETRFQVEAHPHGESFTPSLAERGHR